MKQWFGWRHWMQCVSGIIRSSVLSHAQQSVCSPGGPILITFISTFGSTDPIGSYPVSSAPFRPYPAPIQPLSGPISSPYPSPSTIFINCLEARAGTVSANGAMFFDIKCRLRNNEFHRMFDLVPVFNKIQ